ncbi:putative glycolipid-binding domain-containing protein [Blastococcus sp. SYSU D00922]
MTAPGYAPLPDFAAWRFDDAVDGFEVVYPSPRRLRGHTTAVEDGLPYAVSYDIALDEGWRTREVHVSSETVSGRRSTVLLSDGDGRWTVDGVPAPHLDGLVDVDLEASACTNTLPVHRLSLADGELTAAPAVYVRALDVSVTRLDQTYRRRGALTFDYTSEGGAFRAVLEYDAAGLVVDYPGIARRFA